MTELQIRELGEHDLDALLALYRHLHPEDDPLPPRPELEALWSGVCASPDHLYRGGWKDGELIACCCAAIVPNFTRGARPYAVIENVITRGELRGRGHGSAVLQSLLASCFERGCYKIMLLSGVERDAAHRFYEANGFDPDAKRGFLLRRPGADGGFPMPKGEPRRHVFPDYRIDLEPSAERIRVRLGSELLADSRKALVVRETKHEPVVYLPREDVRLDLFERSDHHTFCPFKGEASYYTLRLAGRVEENLVWSYEDPLDDVAGLKDYLAFYRDRVEWERGG